jgi:hypothetical protein
MVLQFLQDFVTRGITILPEWLRTDLARAAKLSGVQFDEQMPSIFVAFASGAHMVAQRRRVLP